MADDKPIWFYCAQTAKTHCQAGMVGAVNAPAQGDKTFDAFRMLAAKAPPSTIPPNTPLVGTLKVNGTVVADVRGSVLNVTDLHTELVQGGDDDDVPSASASAGGNCSTGGKWQRSTARRPSPWTSRAKRG